MLTNKEIANLVDEDRVHRSVYTDPKIFELEMERIWGHAWIYIGHESQVKSIGDYYATTIGKQAVIMIRHKDGKVYVLFNRCAHKGAQVIADTCGNVRLLRCCYHGWTYDTDGILKHIPHQQGYDGTRFGMGDPMANMQQIPRVANYRGFIFASLAADGPDLNTWLGPAITSFDNTIDRSPKGEIEITGGCLRYLHDSNWKMLIENISDNMHPIVTHQSAVHAAKQMSVEYKNEEKPMALEMLEPFGGPYAFFDEIGLTVCGNGHSYSGGDVSIHSAYPEIPEYVSAMEAAYGKDRTRKILSVNRHNTVIYPSMSFKCALQTIRVYRPIAVNKTIQETWTFRLKGAHEEMLQRSILYNRLIFSPGSIAGHDDWEAYHRLQCGLPSKGAEWVSMHRHAGRDTPNDDGSMSALGTSDIVYRHEFDAWKQYMNREGGS